MDFCYIQLQFEKLVIIEKKKKKEIPPPRKTKTNKTKYKFLDPITLIKSLTRNAHKRIIKKIESLSYSSSLVVHRLIQNKG